jgi:hypothetical protein
MNGFLIMFLPQSLMPASQSGVSTAQETSQLLESWRPDLLTHERRT